MPACTLHIPESICVAITIKNCVIAMQNCVNIWRTLLPRKQLVCFILYIGPQLGSFNENGRSLFQARIYLLVIMRSWCGTSPLHLSLTCLGSHISVTLHRATFCWMMRMRWAIHISHFHITMFMMFMHSERQSHQV